VPGKATKADLNAAIAEADAIVASIAKLQAALNVNDTKFIAVTVGVASERLQEAQRYLRNKLPKAV
jgi:PleD family two-component response regulator